jgi:hypothetical protein
VSCDAGGARPLGRSIRRGHRAGEARALPAIRGADNPEQGAGGASGWRYWGWKRAALGRAGGEAAAVEGDGAHAGAARAAGVATRIADGTPRTGGVCRSEDGLAALTPRNKMHGLFHEGPL